MDYQALIERLRIYSVEIETSTYLGEVIHRLMEDAANAIETLMAERDKNVVPVVDAEWELHHVGHGHYWECTACHTNPCIYVTENTNYCPNCGARMRKDGK